MAARQPALAARMASGSGGESGAAAAPVRADTEQTEFGDAGRAIAVLERAAEHDPSSVAAWKRLVSLESTGVTWMEGWTR